MDEGVLSAEELMKQHQRRQGFSIPNCGAKLTEATDSWEEAHDAKNRLESLRSSIETSRVCQRSQLSEADWDADRGLAVVTKQSGKHWDVFGRYVDNQLQLLPEEALFLLETNAIDIKFQSISMSIQQCYETFLGAKCSLNEYRTFSNLNRLGYKVVRHLPGSLQATNRKRKNNDIIPLSSKKSKESEIIIDGDNIDDIEILSEVNFDRLKVLKNVPNLVFQKRAVLEVPKEDLLPPGARPTHSKYTLTVSESDEGSSIGKLVVSSNHGVISDTTKGKSILTCETNHLGSSAASTSDPIQARRSFYNRISDAAKGKKSRGQKIKNSRANTSAAAPSSNWSKFQWKDKSPEVITLSDDEKPNDSISEVLRTGPLKTLWSSGAVNRPLMRPFQATSIESVYSRLRLCKDSASHEIGKVLKISYDVYGPNTRFRKSSPGPPTFRVVICDEGDCVPTKNDINASTLDLEDQAPLMMAIVSPSDVAYNRICPVALPVELK